MADNTTIIDLSNQAEDINNVPDSILLDKGEEVELRLTGILSGTDKNNFPYLMFFFDVPEQPEVDEISDFVGLPHPSREARDNVKAKRRLKEIGEALDIDWSNAINADELKGRRTYAILGVNKDKTQNTIAEYVTR